MNELSLFTGAGGGVLGSILLGHRIIGYVENNEYCQKLLRQRIRDGILDAAPIFGDIRKFNSEGYAEAYKGMVDIVSGGFPCQDISCAGKGAGITGERSGLWFEMETTIRLVRPKYVFIENSPTLLVRGFDRVMCGLSEMGYDAAWGIISAADVGAPHLRKRLWILGHSMCDLRRQGRTWRSFNAGSGEREPERAVQTLAYSEFIRDRTKIECEKINQTETERSASRVGGPSNGDGENYVADSTRIQQGRPQQWSERKRIGACGEPINDTDAQKQSFGTGLRTSESTGFRRGRSGDIGRKISHANIKHGHNGRHGAGKICRKCGHSSNVSGSEVSDTGQPGLSAPEQEALFGAWGWEEGRTITQRSWWISEPAVGRVAHGVAHRVDRLRAIGNGQVPAVDEAAFMILREIVG